MKETSQMCSPTCGADRLPGEGLAQVHFASLEADASAVPHGNGDVLKGIRQLLKAPVQAW